MGYGHIRQHIDEEVERAIAAAMANVNQIWGPHLVEEIEQNTALPTDPTTAPRGTLHETLEEYKHYLKQTGKRDGENIFRPTLGSALNGWTCCDSTMPTTPCGNWTLVRSTDGSYWKNRPQTKKAKRCSHSFASKMLQELHRYLVWLDRQPKYRWTMPHGVEQLKCSPNDLREDDRFPPDCVPQHNQAYLYPRAVGDNHPVHQ